MEIITLQGDALRHLLDTLSRYSTAAVFSVRVARDVDGVKFKVNEGIWSPGYPETDEDARRRGRA